MSEAQLQVFLEKVQLLNAFVALSEARPELRDALRGCSHHHEVVALAAQHGFEIGRRWGDPGPAARNREDDPPDQPNLFGGPCPPSGEEHVVELLSGPGWRLERIHSCLASSPAGFWYDQLESEWVLVLRGSAQLHFEDEADPRDLCAGDSLVIPPGRRHRVLSTDPAPGTVWLALFWSG